MFCSVCWDDNRHELFKTCVFYFQARCCYGNLCNKSVKRVLVGYYNGAPLMDYDGYVLFIAIYNAFKLT